MPSILRNQLDDNLRRPQLCHWTLCSLQQHSVGLILGSLGVGSSQYCYPSSLKYRIYMSLWQMTKCSRLTSRGKGALSVTYSNFLEGYPIRKKRFSSLSKYFGHRIQRIQVKDNICSGICYKIILENVLRENRYQLSPTVTSPEHPIRKKSSTSLCKYILGTK